MKAGQDIEERLLALGVEAIRLVDRLPRRRWTLSVGNQLIRSVTSAGANYAEARRAESRADFAHKLGVAAKELGESTFWLRLVAKLTSSSEQAIAREAHELTAILVASARTSRKNATT